jgi:pilus assembly protein Flp/PilA
MKHVLRRFVRDESGATAIEYGLIAAIIAVGLIASLQTLQGNLKDTFNSVGTAVKDAK